MNNDSWDSLEDMMLSTSESMKKGTKVTVLLGNVNNFVSSKNINVDNILWN